MKVPTGCIARLTRLAALVLGASLGTTQPEALVEAIRRGRR